MGLLLPHGKSACHQPAGPCFFIFICIFGGKAQLAFQHVGRLASRLPPFGRGLARSRVSLSAPGPRAVVRLPAGRRRHHAGRDALQLRAQGAEVGGKDSLYSLPEFMNFKLFGNTVLVVKIKFGLFLGHLLSQSTCWLFWSKVRWAFDSWEKPGGFIIWQGYPSISPKRTRMRNDPLGVQPLSC